MILYSKTPTDDSRDRLIEMAGRGAPIALPVLVAVLNIITDRENMTLNKIGAQLCFAGSSFDVWAISNLASSNTTQVAGAVNSNRLGLFVLAFAFLVFHMVANHLCLKTFTNCDNNRMHKGMILSLIAVSIVAPVLFVDRF